MGITSVSISNRFARLLAIAALVSSAAIAQQITLYSSYNIAIGQTRQLTAYVPLSPNTVTYTVNGIPGGNATVGTISPSGLFRAPVVVPSPNAVIVTATSTAYPNKSGSATMTITQPPVQLWSTAPTSVAVGNFTITLNGSNFGANSVVNFGGMPLTTTLLSGTGLRATGAATTAQVGTQVPVKVVNTGLGGTTSGAVNLRVTNAAPITVSVAPGSASVAASATRQFSATVTGSTNTSVSWSVNGITGGSAVLGTISGSGLFRAPATVPSPAVVTVQATSAANASSVGSATVTILPPAPPAVTVSVAPSSITLAPSKPQQFAATVTNATDTSVTWSVNGIAGGSAAIGIISTTGLYVAPASIPTPANVTVRATSVQNTSSNGAAAVNIVGPPNPGTGQGLGNLSAGRFLEQSTFGPTPADIAHLQQIGIDTWLTEQFNTPETQIVDPGSQNSGLLQTQYVSRLSSAQDQLRQRVAYSLSKIIVISMNKNNYPDQVVPYLQILSRNAFGNYRTLLGEISVSSQMGKYLDLARSTKPGPAGGANENYARELLQLFTIGIYKLNPDGSQQVDGQGRPIAAYDQTTVQQVALALTGWIYKNNAWEDFTGPMVPREANHDTTQKSFLGCTLASGQNTQQDMDGLLDCLFAHPNMGPFVATRLIRSLVTSNPSPAYIQRISGVFDNNGSAVRGDLQAVVKAILTDAEARNDTATANSGRLKEPILHITSFVRALNGTISPTNGWSWLFSRIAQTPLTPPSVFSYYSPLYRIPQSPLFGPEFQIYTPTEAVLRGNFLWAIISNPASDASVDLSPFASAVSNIPQLIDAVDQRLLYGRMPAAMRQSIATAIAAQSDNTSKMQTALYLTAISGLYAVQY